MCLGLLFITAGMIGLLGCATRSRSAMATQMNSEVSLDKNIEEAVAAIVDEDIRL